MKRKPVILAYDISDDRRRRKVFKILKDWRLEGQKSVCECFLSQEEAEELFLQLGGLINRKTDHLMLAWLDRRRKGKALGLGRTFTAKSLVQVR